MKYFVFYVVILLIITKASCQANDDFSEPGVLHNPYVSDWIQMTPEEALNYYTPYEVCRLYDLMERGSSINCDDIKPKGFPEKCYVDSIGYGTTPTNCFSNKGAQLRHKSTPSSLSTGNFHSVVNAMKKMGSNTIVMIGDSITSQHVSDAYCNAHRIGFDAQLIDIAPFPHETIRQPSFTVKQYNNIGNDTVPYFQVLSLLFERLHMNPGDENNYDPSRASHPYDTFWKLPSIEGKIVIIFNAGLHDHEPGEYKATIHVLIKYLQYHMKDHLIFFRETSAQHFNTPTGEFPWGDKSFNWQMPASLHEEIVSNLTKLVYDDRIVGQIMINTNKNSLEEHEIETAKKTIMENHQRLQSLISASYNCIHPQHLPNQNWKNQIVINKIKELDPHQVLIKILPFYEITAGRYDAHSRVRKDCSHYCNNPMLYLPIWHTLYLELLKQSS